MRVRWRLSLPFALFLLALGARADKSGAVVWNDTPRDVWVDGALDRDAQVFACREPRRLAVVARSLADVLVLDLSSETVATAPREAFHFAADRASASTERELPLTTLCKCHVVDTGTLLLEAGGKTVLVARHQGAQGDLTQEQLFETVPVWRSLKDAYTPVAGAVATIAACDTPTDVTVVLGTWCGDSKNHVPKLLKALQAAGNANVRVRFVGLASRFADPMEVIQGRHIINVPTVIVERAGKELGRIVETPATHTVEEDLAAILSGTLPEHGGRYARGQRLASGTYERRDASGAAVGTETFEVWETKDSGVLVHSRLMGREDVDVWQGLDEKRQPDFLEVTKRRGETLERARFWRDGTRLTGHLRGSDTGIVDQNLAVPKELAMLSPASAATGLSLRAAPAGVCYVAPGGLDERLGALRDAHVERAGSERVTVPAGAFLADTLVITGDVPERRLWLHPELGVPVRSLLRDGGEVVLTSLEVPDRG